MLSRRVSHLMTERTIGILGSGDVGKALGRGFAARGWEVTLGTRSPADLDEWLLETEGDVSVGDFADAATRGDVVVLAVLGEAAEEVVEHAGPDQFAGKLVLDATNPLDLRGESPPALLYGGTDSLGERIQAALPDASVVKCFNTVSNLQMVDPQFEEGTPPMMICGDDVDAKNRTEELLVELGWPGAMDVGGIEASRYLEALVPLWVRVGSVLDTWRHAFKPVQ
jgi:hypothetical protein